MQRLIIQTLQQSIRLQNSKRFHHKLDGAVPPNLTAEKKTETKIIVPPKLINDDENIHRGCDEKTNLMFVGGCLYTWLLAWMYFDDHGENARLRQKCTKLEKDKEQLEKKIRKM